MTYLPRCGRLSARTALGGTDAHRLGDSELGECWSVVGIRICGCTYRQFSVFQTPAGGCHSNGDTFRCALYFVDLLSSRSCPPGNEIELNSYAGRLKFRGDRFRNMAIRLGAISASELDVKGLHQSC